MTPKIEQGIKTVEHVAVTSAISTGTVQLMYDHQGLILMFCTMGGFVIGLVSAIVSCYYKHKNYKLAEAKHNNK